MDKVSRYAPIVAQVLLGLLYTVFGLNYFLKFAEMPPQPEAAGAFLGAMGATGYLFPLVKVCEIVGGLLLLSGRFALLGLVIVTPVTVNIAAFHFALNPGEAGMSIGMLVLTAIIAWGARSRLGVLFGPKKA